MSRPPALDLATGGSRDPTLEHGVARAVEVADNTARALFETILTLAEEPVDWLESQLERIRQVSERNYLAQRIRA